MGTKVPNKEIYPEITTVSPQQVASALGLNRRTVLRMLGDGRIPGVKVGRKWVITQRALNELLQVGVYSVGKPFTPEPDDIKDYFYARYSYERILLLQPHVEMSGLFFKNGHYFAVCPNEKNTFSDDGHPIADWFEAHKVLGGAIRVVADAPEGAVPVPNRSIMEIVELSGDPLTRSDVNDIVSFKMRPSFPFIGLSEESKQREDGSRGERIFVVNVERQLARDEEDAVREVMDTFNLSSKIEIRVQEKKEPAAPSSRRSPVRDDPRRLNLVISKNLPPHLPAGLRTKWEEDEDYWLTAKHVLWSPDAGSINPLPNAFLGPESKCLVDSSTFPVRNIRTYLALFNKVIFLMPLHSSLKNFLEAIQISERELIQLVANRRVQFIMPQSLLRYSPAFCADLCEVAPDSMLFSRRLAVASIVDARKRNPLLYPQADMHERHLVLQALVTLANAERDQVFRQVLLAMIEGLKIAWSQTEYRLQFQGAMAIMATGMGNFIGEAIKRISSVDIQLEAGFAMQSVEMAGAVGATLFPVDTKGYSSQGISEMCAAVYSGVRSEMVAEKFTEVETVLQGLLAPVNDADVLEMCNIFKGDIPRKLYATVEKIVLSSATKEDLDEQIRAFNREVRKVEKRRSRLAKIDISTIAGMVATSYIVEPRQAVIPWAVWLLGRLLAAYGGTLPEWLRGFNRDDEKILLRPQDAVFVAKIKRRLL